VSDVGIERIMVGKFVCGCTWAQNIDQVQWRYQVIELPHVSNLHNNELLNTVEPLNKGHFGSRAFRRLSFGGRFEPICPLRTWHT